MQARTGAISGQVLKADKTDTETVNRVDFTYL